MPSIFISSNFMLNDIFCLAVATAAMPLFILIPGYVFGWLVNIFAFRERRMVTRLLIGIALSITIFPSAIYLLARLTSFDQALFLYSILWAIFVWLVIKERKRIHFSVDSWTRIAVLLTFVWVLAAIVSLPDIQIGQRLYLNGVSFDHQMRIALTDAIYRTGIPPANPHIYPGSPQPVSYYYFWYVFPALLSRLTGGLIDSRIAFYAGIVWIGIALRAAACLYLRFQSPEANQSIGQRSVAAIGLFFITGLDVIFASILLARLPESIDVTEWWNGNSQVTAWAGATLWVPHHVAGLIAGITGILIFQSISREMSIRRQTLLIVLTAFSLASLIGLSIFVAFIFAIFWEVYFICSLVLKKWRHRVPWLIAAGFVTFLLALPFLVELFHSRMSFSMQTQGSIISFEVRKFGILEWALSGKPAWLVNLFNFTTLPINYFLELGFFMLAGMLYIQSAARERRLLWDRLGIDLLLLASSGIFCSFFRSTILGTNDVGWRGFMPVQFILLVWGANVLVSVWKRWFGDHPLLYAIELPIFTQSALAVLLIIGLVSTLFNLSFLRLNTVFNDKNAWGSEAYAVPEDTWGRRSYAIREAYRYINDHYPITIIEQNNPQVESLIIVHQGQYGLRQTASTGEGYSFIYGDTSDVYQAVSARILPIFRNTRVSWQEVEKICRDTQINVLLIKDVDPVWKDSTSWVWRQTPVYHNGFTRVFSCK